MATAASATPTTPGEDPGEEPVPIMRFEDDIEAPRWNVVLEHEAEDYDRAYGGHPPVPPDEWTAHKADRLVSHADQRAPVAVRLDARWSRPASREYRAYGTRPGADETKARKRAKKVKLSRAKPRHATLHLSHRAATRWFKKAGLRWTSSGGCTNRRVRTCTSLDSVRTTTVERVVELKKRSGCPITITGGTETGHATGRFSHGSGHKLDIGHNACIDRYIKKIAKRTGVRGDGATLYRAPSGTVYADEGDHWDILFR